MVRKTPGAASRRAPCTRDTRVAPAPRRVGHRIGIERMDLDRGATEIAPRHDREAADCRGEAREPPITRRIDPEARARRVAEAITASIVKTTPFAHRSYRRRDDESVSVGGRSPTWERVVSVAVTTTDGANGSKRRRRAGREVAVHRPCGVAVVEYRCNYRRSGAAEGRGDEPAHGGSLTAAMATEEGLIPTWVRTGDTPTSLRPRRGDREDHDRTPRSRNAFRPQTLIELSGRSTRS